MTTEFNFPPKHKRVKNTKQNLIYLTSQGEVSYITAEYNSIEIAFLFLFIQAKSQSCSVQAGNLHFQIGLHLSYLHPWCSHTTFKNEINKKTPSSSLRILYVYYISITTFHQQKLYAHWKWIAELVWVFSPLIKPCYLTVIQKLETEWKIINLLQYQLALSFLSFPFSCVCVYSSDIRLKALQLHGMSQALTQHWAPISLLECPQWLKPYLLKPKPRVRVLKWLTVGEFIHLYASIPSTHINRTQLMKVLKNCMLL